MKPILCGTVAIFSLLAGALGAAASQPEKVSTESDRPLHGVRRASQQGSQPEKVSPENSSGPVSERERLIDIGVKLDMLISQLKKVERETSPDGRPCVKEIELRKQAEKETQRAIAAREEAQKAANRARAELSDAEKKLRQRQLMQRNMSKALEDIFWDSKSGPAPVKSPKEPAVQPPFSSKSATLVRATYFVPRDRADLLILFLKDIKAPIDAKFEQDTLIVTTTPEAQRVIAQFISLTADPQADRK